MHEAHRVRGPRPQTPFVVMREELRLVRRHVDIHRTFALASLAGKTEIERVLHVLVLPSAVERIALEHLEEQAGATTRRMRLFACRPIARTHCPAFVAATLADADAPDRRE